MFLVNTFIGYLILAYVVFEQPEIIEIPLGT